MALSQTQALEELKTVVKSAASTAAFDNAYWTMAILYNGGTQWGFVNRDGGQLQTRYLRNVTDPLRTDVRVTMNEIGKLTDKIRSEINPATISASYDAISGGADEMVISDLGGRMMKQHLLDIDALRTWRDANRARCILGTCGIRRTLALKNPRMGFQKGGKAAMGLRDYTIGWSQTFPWEYIRDPSSVSLWPAKDEHIVVHFKPRTVKWIKQHFPDVEIKDATPMGKLMDFYRSIRAASGLVGSARTADSKAPGLMFYEAHFKEGNEWNAVLYAYGEPEASGTTIKPAGFFPNPFYGLPHHFIHYDHPIQMPWGRGIPHILAQAQNLHNLGWTWILRSAQTSGGKWIIEKGTLEKPGRVLSNRMDEPIIWDRAGSGNNNAKEPHLAQGAAPSPAAMQLVSSVPTWMRDALNLSEVQSGITSKRGESSAAIRAKLEQAGVPLDDLRREDELVLEGLLLATLYDLTNPKWVRLDGVQALVGADVPREHVRTLVRFGTRKAIGSATVHPMMLRPRTKDQTRETFTGMVETGVIQAFDAVWEMYKQNKVVVNTAMANAIRKQLSELSRMVSGEDVEPAALDHHDYHVRALREYADRPEWHNFPKAVRDRIMDHWIGHLEAAQALAQIEAMGLGPQAPDQGSTGQGSPPAMPEGPAAIPGGAAAPLQAQAVA